MSVPAGALAPAPAARPRASATEQPCRAHRIFTSRAPSPGRTPEMSDRNHGADPFRSPHTRRAFLHRGGSLGLATAGLSGGWLWRAAAAAAAVHKPDSLPNPGVPAGTVDAAMPFDHIVVVMMENHSFDNLLGALAHAGQPKADGLHFTTAGRRDEHAIPGHRRASVRSFPRPTTAQAPDVTQTWNATHAADRRRQDGRLRQVGRRRLSRWATGHRPRCCRSPTRWRGRSCVANRWFCSAPCQTYPNRRFLMAGTAYGDIATDTREPQDPPPPNGTIFDRLHAYGDQLDATTSPICRRPAIIPSIDREVPGEHRADRAVLRRLRGRHAAVGELRRPRVRGRSANRRAAGRPCRCSRRRSRRSSDASAATRRSRRTCTTARAGPIRSSRRSCSRRRGRGRCCIYTYDEHGGYYDHVPPPRGDRAGRDPAGARPRRRAGRLQHLRSARAGDRRLALLQAQRGHRTCVHDHTSVLATIEAKWNLPRADLPRRERERRSWTSSTSQHRGVPRRPRRSPGRSLTGPSGPVD